MTTNRSSEELAMRDALDAWGRTRWPDARVVHELVTGACRIDMAFVSPDHLVGVEIKSSRDTLDRLKAQEEAFAACIPELWVALAPKWQGKSNEAGYHTGVVIVADGRVDHTIRFRSGSGHDYAFERKPDLNRALTVPMLDLLWRNELHAIAARVGAWKPKGTPARPVLIGAIARALTGDQIVAEVCRELRARDAFWRSDPPVVLPGYTAADMPGRVDLYQKPTQPAAGALLL